MYEEIAEVVAGSDEVLMEKYFSGEKFTREDLLRGVTTALLEGDAVPLLVGSGEKGIGIDILLNTIVNYMPAPDDDRAHLGFRFKEGEERKVSAKDPFAAVVFKTVSDPFLGKISIFKVISGILTKNTPLYNVTTEETEKLGGLFVMRGKEQIEVDEIYAGDIGATTKLAGTLTGDTLCDEKDHVILENMEFPDPVISVAIEPKTKASQDKMALALAKLAEEDPTFKTHTDEETGQTIISGMGELHLDIIVDRLLREFKVEANIGNPQVSYREGIRKAAEGEAKYARQSGGRGQYGHAKIRIEPLEPGEGFVFENAIVGGAIPKEFIGPTQQGIEEALQSGIVGGYEVLDVKVTLYDGSYHEVDSSEMAFKIAGSMAVRDALAKADPVLLEPMMKVEVTTPEEYMGDVIGDINSRRGRMEGMELVAGAQIVTAYVPLAEMFGYATSLRSNTQGRANYSMQFDHYEEVPASIAEEVVGDKKNN